LKEKKEVPRIVEVEMSAEMASWFALPRSKRDRLTKKQIARINKPDLATDAVGVAEVRQQKKKGTLVVEDASQKAKES